jgi:hypothetical protein
MRSLPSDGFQNTVPLVRLSRGVLHPGLVGEQGIGPDGDVPALPHDMKELIEHWRLPAALDPCRDQEKAQRAGDHQYNVHEVLSHWPLLSSRFCCGLAFRFRGGVGLFIASGLRRPWQGSREDRDPASSVTVAAYGTGQGSTRQLSEAYSAMVRSLENLPEWPTFRIAFRAQAFSQGSPA